MNKYINLTSELKDKHLANNLSSRSDNPDTALETSWSFMNKFLNKKGTCCTACLF